ncbi:hypothetical protein [Natrononativus amylolyticus]|uniref:hypothetical protein n=1 Tax=Natrononativus amylolyticus TaxID=2963434 RepID=UPI0020CBFA78|nr:hypothetical protein [Natrononativus amylolyticus]
MVYALVGTISAIKGSYVLIGLLLAYSITAVVIPGERSHRTMRTDRYLKLLVISWLFALAVAVLTANRLYGLLIGLPIGYLLLGLQLRSKTSPPSYLFQIALLFSLGPLTKYLTNGFYFGEGDIFHNSRWINELVESGQLASLERYADFPGYHLLSATVSAVTDLPAYDTVVMVQLSAFVMSIVVIYLLGEMLLKDARLAIIIALGMSLVFWMSFYVMRGVPQTVATTLVVFILYIAFRSRIQNTNLRCIAMGIIVGFTLVFTHHLTILLFAPIIAVILLTPWIQNRYTDIPSARQPQALVFIITGVLAVFYWSVQGQFTGELLYFSRIMLQAVISTGEGAGNLTYAFGYTLPPLSARSAARSLLTPEGIYFILLVTVSTLGIQHLLSRLDRYSNVLGLCLVGILGAPLVLRSPILTEHDRLRLSFAIFFVFLVGIGLLRVLEAGHRARSAQVIFLVLLVALGTLSPLIAGDDMYSVRQGESLYDDRPLPEPDKEFSAGEYNQLRDISSFAQASDGGISSFSHETRALEMFGVDNATDDSLYVSSEGLDSDRSLFLYRDRWPDHRTPHDQSETLLRITMSETWLEQLIVTENKVYDTGEMGLLWKNDGGTYGSEATETVDTGTQ